MVSKKLYEDKKYCLLKKGAGVTRLQLYTAVIPAVRHNQRTVLFSVLRVPHC